MLKKKITVLASTCVALGSLLSLASCGTKYDLVIYNWEDYIYEGTDENGKKTEKGTIERFEE